MLDSGFGMLDFIKPHLVNNGSGTLILLWQSVQMPIKMGLNLTLCLSKKPQVPFIPQGARRKSKR